MKSLEAILTDMASDFGLFPLWELYEWLDAKVRQSGLASLTNSGRAIFLAQRYDGGMFQGGFDTLLRWDPGLGIMPMVMALEQVGARQTAAVLADLASLFPSGAIPDDAHLRIREFDDVESSQEQQMERLRQALRCAEREEDICQLCLEFALKRLADLRREDGESCAAPDSGSIPG